MTTPAPRADSRRRQSANGRNRERWASTARRALGGFDVGTYADDEYDGTTRTEVDGTFNRVMPWSSWNQRRRTQPERAGTDLE